jgi:hypothetical protein
MVAPLESLQLSLAVSIPEKAVLLWLELLQTVAFFQVEGSLFSTQCLALEMAKSRVFGYLSEQMLALETLFCPWSLVLSLMVETWLIHLCQLTENSRT